MATHDQDARARATGKPLLTVLQQFNAPTPKTNPYLVQLLAALSPLVRVRFWSLRTALLSRYDVVPSNVAPKIVAESPYKHHETEE